MKIAVWAMLTAGVVSAACGEVAAQEMPDSGNLVSDRRGVGRTAEAQLLDAPIDRQRYRLGPGDQLDVFIFGDLNREYSLTVTPEGTVVLPGAGVTPVLGLTIDTAEARLAELLGRYYHNIRLYAALADVRRFKVFVVGDVSDPGIRLASATTRVSEVIPPPSDSGVIRRRVLVQRATGDSLTVDLARYRQLGDLRHNPRLSEGDVLLVPSVNRTVQVFGDVAFPGKYEFVSGESLADLLTLANGREGFRDDAADVVRVTRFVGPDQQLEFEFDQVEALGGKGRAFILQPFDAAYIARIENFKESKTARVEGEVRFPGVYPIIPGVTSIRELIEAAGGITERASLTGAILKRQSFYGGASFIQRLQSTPPALLSSGERRLLQAGAQGGSGLVVVDLKRILTRQDSATRTVLEEGDVLTIPQQRNQVLVLGAVLRPGIVQFVPGAGVLDFVRLAGGFARQADRGDIAVVKANSTSQITAQDVQVLDPGDTVIVPYEEHHDWLQLLQAASTVASAATALVLTVFAVFR